MTNANINAYLKITLNSSPTLIEEDAEIELLDQEMDAAELMDAIIDDIVADLDCDDINISEFKEPFNSIQMTIYDFTTPIDLNTLQNLCNLYDFNIFGAMIDLNNDYIDIIDLSAQIDVEDTTNHFVEIEGNESIDLSEQINTEL